MCDVECKRKYAEYVFYGQSSLPTLSKCNYMERIKYGLHMYWWDI